MLYHKRLFHAIIYLVRTMFDIILLLFYNDLKYCKKLYNESRACKQL